MTETDLSFFTDQNKKKIFLSIPKETIIQINKHQSTRHDIFCFSIFYQLPNKDSITEIKLKTTSRGETDRWIRILRKIVQPKKYVFKYEKISDVEPSVIIPYKSTRDFYIKLCHLEYIVNRSYMKSFFNKINTHRNNHNHICTSDSKTEIMDDTVNDNGISNYIVDEKDIGVEI